MATINSMSNYLENKVLVDNLVNTPCFVGLFTSNPGDEGTGIEVSGGSYARKSISFVVSGNRASNGSEVSFATATSLWGGLTHFAIFDRVTGGNLLFHGALETNGGVPFTYTMNSGDSFRFPINSLSITLD